MTEKFLPPENNNKNPELEALLKIYPLPEKFKDKAELTLELKKISDSLSEKDANKKSWDNYEALRLFIENLRNKYVKDESKNKKGAGDYYLLHMVIGSTGMKTTEFDFPGEDSIEKFLRLRELMSKLND
ncbi:MAG: hypothetical protein Q7S81_01480 [bacterium]|nr:hypothetical protein [bacterium]